ncbi:hypothetical protein ACH5RR_028635 [Cinchona calisaya]|uniref:ATP-dependent DNA helicase n=1 Tax=Cinchona calisaya TaxID=153742 RepID=A0ABD2YPC9_9GENT
MRVRGDPNFNYFLLQVGSGEKPTTNDNMIRLPEEMVMRYERGGDPEQKLIDQSILPSLQQNANSTEYLTKRAILAAKNETVDMLNERVITEFPGEEMTSKALTKQWLTPITIIKKKF